MDMDMDKYMDKERGAGGNKAYRFFRNHNAGFIPDNSKDIKPRKARFLTYTKKCDKERNDTAPLCHLSFGLCHFYRIAGISIQKGIETR